MKRMIAVMAAAVVVGLMVASSHFGWFTIISTPEGVGEHKLPVTMYRMGGYSIVEYYPFGSSIPERALMRSRDIQVDERIRGSRLNNGKLVIGESREIGSPVLPVAILGGLLALTFLWRAVRRARLAQLRRLAS